MGLLGDFLFSPYWFAVLLGAVQFVLGVALGVWWCRSGNKSPAISQSDLQRLRRIIDNAHDLAALVADDVGEYRVRLMEIANRLHPDGTSHDDQSQPPAADVVADVIGELVHINGRLQSRLA